MQPSQIAAWRNMMQRYPMYVIQNASSGPVDYHNMASEMGRRLGFQYMTPPMPQPNHQIQSYQERTVPSPHRLEELQKNKKILEKKRRQKEDDEFIPTPVVQRQAKQISQPIMAQRAQMARAAEPDYNSANNEVKKAHALKTKIEHCVELGAKLGAFDFFSIDHL
jgi:hypothetical protein